MESAAQGFPRETGGPSVVTTGVFDGVHLGHKAIISALTNRAEKEGLLPTVVTLGNHPEQTLNPGEPPVFLLTSLEHRTALLKKSGCKNVVMLDFDEELAATSAEDFLKMLIERINCKRLVLGEDARIGRGGVAVPDLPADELGLGIEVVPTVTVDGEKVSSTRIRRLIYETRLDEAAQLLGRRFSSFGKVIPGRRRGTGLGFPTLNINVEREVRPPFGVYAGWMIIEGMGMYDAVTNIGVRPTFERPGADLIIETHVMDRELPELHGRRVEFIYAAKVRDERLFTSPQALQKQISEDVGASLKILSREGKPCSDDYVLSC